MFTDRNENMMINPAIHHPSSLNVGSYFQSAKCLSPAPQVRNHPGVTGAFNARSSSVAQLSVLRKTDGLADYNAEDHLSLPRQETIDNSLLYFNSVKEKYAIKKNEDEWSKLYEAKRVQAEAQEAQKAVERKRMQVVYRLALQN